jgi:hypothetical protein
MEKILAYVGEVVRVLEHTDHGPIGDRVDGQDLSPPLRPILSCKPVKSMRAVMSSRPSVMGNHASVVRRADMRQKDDKGG